MTDDNRPDRLPPAFYFTDQESVLDVLTHWGRARRELDAARDLIIAAALEFKVPWETIRELTGVAKTTISRIPRRPMAVDTFESLPVYEQILRTRAEAAQAAVTKAAKQNRGLDEPSEEYMRAAAAHRTLEFAVRSVGREDPLPPGYPDTEDGALAALDVWLRERLADARTNGAETGWAAGVRSIAEQLVTEIADLRAHGTLPEPEAAAATVELATTSLRFEAESAGVDFEKYAAMTREERAAVWAALPAPDADDSEVQADAE